MNRDRNPDRENEKGGAWWENPRPSPLSESKDNPEPPGEEQLIRPSPNPEPDPPPSEE